MNPSPLGKPSILKGCHPTAQGQRSATLGTRGVPRPTLSCPGCYPGLMNLPPLGKRSILKGCHPTAQGQRSATLGTRCGPRPTLSSPGCYPGLMNPSPLGKPSRPRSAKRYLGVRTRRVILLTPGVPYGWYGAFHTVGAECSNHMERTAPTVWNKAFHSNGTERSNSMERSGITSRLQLGHQNPADHLTQITRQAG